MWNGWHQGGGMPYDGGWFWWIPFHGPFGLIVGILAIVAVVALVRHLWRGGPAPAASDGAALGILESRYVNGEIDRDSYLRMKKDLS